MQIRYDRMACSGWFQCVQEWDAFEMNTAEGKADLAGSEEVPDGVFVREVPEEYEDEAREAVKACPVDAISIEES